MTAKQVIKIIKISLLVLAVAIVILGFSRFISNKESSYPYPYTIKRQSKSQIERAEKADILIVGDSTALQLNKYLEKFIKNASKKLKKPLKIYNWAKDDEPLAITLAKVKSLKKLPMLTLYHGGISELDHKRFFPQDIPKIHKNLKLIKNDGIHTLLITFPFLSRLIYTPINYVKLTHDSKGHSAPKGKSYGPKLIQHILKLHYSFYTKEAQDLFTHYKLNDANIWVIPAALNVETKPIKVCSNTESQATFDGRSKIDKYIKMKAFKDARNASLKLIQDYKANSLNYYQLAQILMANGMYTQARSALYHARMYDCGLNQSTPIHLKILMEEAEKRDFKVIDFNRMVLDHLGRNKLFFDEEIPQGLFYESLMSKLNTLFKKLLEG
jgi:hypothetical protein